MYTMSQINHIKDLSNCGYRISEISKKTGADGFSWVIGYTYNVVASVTDVDSHLIQELSELLSGGLEYVDYSDSSHLYSFSGKVYLPCGSKGQAWE